MRKSKNESKYGTSDFRLEVDIKISIIVWSMDFKVQVEMY